uniref:Uncharacterized protein n=1 Tax=Lygus hesperus TaxID=30085 RepID=A0A0K8SV72_LYGHE
MIFKVEINKLDVKCSKDARSPKRPGHGNNPRRPYDPKPRPGQWGSEEYPDPGDWEPPKRKPRPYDPKPRPSQWENPKQKPKLSRIEIEYFMKNAVDWHIPTVYAFVSGTKKVINGRTIIVFVYKTREGGTKNCKVTLQVNNQSGTAKQKCLCGKRITGQNIEDDDDARISQWTVIKWRPPGIVIHGEQPTDLIPWGSPSSKQKALTKADIRYLVDCTVKWKLPRVKSIIEGHKTVRGRETMIVFVYISYHSKCCTLNVNVDNETGSVKDNRWSCVRKKSRYPGDEGNANLEVNYETMMMKNTEYFKE